jgi:hypothetical protein
VVEGGQSGGYSGQVGLVAHVDLDDVAAGPLLELAGGAGGDGPAVVDDHHPAGQVVGLVQVLGGEQHVGAGRDQAADGVPELDAAAGVQPGGRLVEQQQPRRADQAGAQVELAAHAARVGPDQPVGGVREPQLGEHLGAVGFGRAGVLAEQPGHQVEVLAAGHGRLHGRGLAGQADHPPNGRGLAAHVVAGHPQLAPVGAQQGGHRAHEGGLAGPVGAEDGQDLARLGDQVDPVQGGGLAESLAEAGSLDGWGHVVPTSWLLGWLLGGDLHVGAAVDLDLVAALRSARLAALQPQPAADRAELLVVEGQVAQ